MTTYIAENIETGEVIEGCAKELAKKIGVAVVYADSGEMVLR